MSNWVEKKRFHVTQVRKTVVAMATVYEGREYAFKRYSGRSIVGGGGEGSNTFWEFLHSGVKINWKLQQSNLNIKS